MFGRQLPTQTCFLGLYQTFVSPQKTQEFWSILFQRIIMKKSKNLVYLIICITLTHIFIQDGVLLRITSFAYDFMLLMIRKIFDSFWLHTSSTLYFLHHLHVSGIGHQRTHSFGTILCPCFVCHNTGWNTTGGKERIHGGHSCHRRVGNNLITAHGKKGLWTTEIYLPKSQLSPTQLPL